MSDMADAIAAVEAEGLAETVAARAARRVARAKPERKAKRNRGRAQRNRGMRAERQVAVFLVDYGFRRVPLSGALGGRLSGDVARMDSEHTVIPVRGTWPVIATLEVKRRQSCDTTLRAQLAQGKADALVRVPGGTLAPLVILTLEKFRFLLQQAGYVVEDGQ